MSKLDFLKTSVNTKVQGGGGVTELRPSQTLNEETLKIVMLRDLTIFNHGV